HDLLPTRHAASDVLDNAGPFGTKECQTLVRYLASVLRQARFWKRGHTRLLLAQVSNRGQNQKSKYTDRDHLLAAARWLQRAQDVAPDGGVCGRYHLSRGW